MRRGLLQGGLCGCLMQCPPEELLRMLNHPDLDLVEWRLDSFSEMHGTPKTLDMLRFLSVPDRKPVIATSRLKRDGGRFEGDEAQRMHILERATEAGADWIDLEVGLDVGLYRRFLSTGCRLVVSHHDFSGTPAVSHLRRKLEQMAATGAHVVKIATFARKPEDNLRVLELIAYGNKAFNVRVVAFCMGREGRWSRAVCLLLGSPWSYVCLPDQDVGAPGQLTVEEMRRLLELLAQNAGPCQPPGATRLAHPTRNP